MRAQCSGSRDPQLLWTLVSCAGPTQYPLHRPLLWVLNNSILVSLIFFSLWLILISINRKINSAVLVSFQSQCDRRKSSQCELRGHQVLHTVEPSTQNTACSRQAHSKAVCQWSQQFRGPRDHHPASEGCPKHASLGPAFEGKLGSVTPSLAKLPAEKLEIILEGWTAIQDRRWTPGLERAQRGLISPRPGKLTSVKLEPDCYVIYDFVFGFVFFFLFLLNHWQLISEDFGFFFFFFTALHCPSSLRK